MSVQSVILLQEDLEKIHWQTFKHPLYSINVSPPCDITMYGSLKEELEGRRFDNDYGNVCPQLLVT